MIRPGVFCPQNLPMYGPTVKRNRNKRAWLDAFNYPLFMPFHPSWYCKCVNVKDSDIGWSCITVLIEQNILPPAFCWWKWKGQCLFCKCLWPWVSVFSGDHKFLHVLFIPGPLWCDFPEATLKEKKKTCRSWRGHEQKKELNTTKSVNGEVCSTFSREKYWRNRRNRRLSRLRPLHFKLARM